jgi:hypothetical protein
VVKFGKAVPKLGAAIAVAIVGASVLGIIVIATLNPLRRSPDRIRASLLEVTPLASTMTDVRRVLEQKKWLNTKYSGTAGFVKHEPGRPIVVVGATSLCGLLGEYYEFPVPLVTSVEAYWGFDRNGTLIEVWVRKTTDGP